MSEILERCNIDKKYKWDLSAIYPTDDAFREALKAAEELIKRFPENEKNISAGADGLYKTLTDMAKIESYIQKLWQYASLGFSVDMQNNEAQAKTSLVRNLAVSASTAWAIPSCRSC